MKKRILKILLFDLLLMMFTVRVSAASYSISAGSTNLTKGKSTKLTIKGSDLAGRFNITTSNSNVISISEDRVWIDNNSYSITLTANGVGTATIKVTPSDVSGYNGSAANLASKSINITVSLPREKSSDNNLSNLSVVGYEISPAFSKDTLDYKVSVPEGTTNVNIRAVANSKYATITGGGEVSVTDGVNNFSIVVRSETGVDKVYNVQVEVLDQDPINIEVDGVSYTIVKLRKNFTCSDDFQESEVVISDHTIPACVNDNINYTLIGLKDIEGNIKSYVYNPNNTNNKYYSLYSYAYSSDLKIIITDEKELENSEKTKIIIEGVEYNAYKYGNSTRYYVVYGKNIETGEEDFYLYDSKNNTFSTYDTSLIDSLSHQNEIYLYVIIAFGACLFLSIICIISLNAKKNKIVKGIKKEENKKKDSNKKVEDIKNEIIEEDTTYDIFEDEKHKNKRKKK